MDLHAELSDGIESLRCTAPKWAQLVVDFKRWGFRTWLKEAESNMNTGSTDDVFGSDSIGEQAALNAEMPSENKLKSHRPRKAGLSLLPPKRSLPLC